MKPPSQILPATSPSPTGGTAVIAHNPHQRLLRALACVGMLVIFIVSVSWSIFLGILSAAPNATANYVMSTTQYDDGEFWQLTKQSSALAAAAMVGQVVIVVVYGYLIVLLLQPHGVSKCRRVRPSMTGQSMNCGNALLSRMQHNLPPSLQLILTAVPNAARNIFHYRGKYRKAWNLVLEVLELICQIMTLDELLARGVDARLVHIYVMLMLVNCVYCFYSISIAWRTHAFYEIVIDAILDGAFAIVFPAIVFLNAVRSFRGGLQTMAILQRYFPAETHERRARIYGDSRSINIFTTVVDGLRILTPGNLFIFIGFNLMTCIRWYRIVAALTRDSKRSDQCTEGNMSRCAQKSVPSGAPPGPTVEHSDSTRPSIGKMPTAPRVSCEQSTLVTIPHRVVPAFVGVLFLVFGAGVALYVSRAIVVSREACAPFVDTCGLHAHAWNPVAADVLCPCLVFIDIEISPSLTDTYSLPDVSSNLSMLAEAGKLRTVQIVNRNLNYELPTMLQKCTDLRHLILIHTNVEEMPDWMVVAFQNLEYLHVKGSTTGSLTKISANAFSGMKCLHTLQLEDHTGLETVPPLPTPSSLRTLYLGNLVSITEIPSLEHSTKLETLALSGLQYVKYLPDLAPIATSAVSVTIKTSALCCSGFLNHGACNTTRQLCYAYQPALSTWNTCYPSSSDAQVISGEIVIGSPTFPLISDESRAFLEPFVSSLAVCDPNEADPIAIFVSPRFDKCQGVRYRQCAYGICYNWNLGSVVCSSESWIIAMRKEEIEVGQPCDVEEEAWLGCRE